MGNVVPFPHSNLLILKSHLIWNSLKSNQELGTYAYYVAVFEWLKSLLNVGGSKQLMSGRLVDPSHQRKIQQVIEHVEKLVDIDDIPQDQLSPKVIALNKILANYQEKDDHDNFLCIVFVERRQYAHLLSILLQRNALLKDFIRPAPLTGHGAGNEVDLIGIKMDSKTVKTCASPCVYLPKLTSLSFLPSTCVIAKQDCCKIQDRRAQFDHCNERSRVSTWLTKQQSDRTRTPRGSCAVCSILLQRGTGFPRMQGGHSI